ncbi:hypothetical protein CathTA2_1707 [Caldalkalibacillus thermarum TA2.A1]|uniref:YtkA-like domain-containing protein n=2 Tax=Caldalkalibacillus thermarum (strain TA2.A1) TaxID=986075 RepID=F5L7A7_CALTT|nr:FixH family protein [Caldalkalibacillus thermarum]EGL82768.1 hypothetical protein CathTA2_1707 [Caldalkalibacillus thermarum TA2.A1]
MHKRSLVLLLLSVVLILAGCQDQQDAQDEPYIPEAPIEVQFGTDPETPHPAGQPLTLFVRVTQEGEGVEDADEVLFEIWREDSEHHGDQDGHSNGDAEHRDHQQSQQEEHQDGQDSPAGHGHPAMDGYETDHDMLEAEHAGDGLYQLEISFDEPGTYYVMYHVTARGYHDMVRHEIEIIE